VTLGNLRGLKQVRAAADQARHAADAQQQTQTDDGFHSELTAGLTHHRAGGCTLTVTKLCPHNLR